MNLFHAIRNILDRKFSVFFILLFVVICSSAWIFINILNILEQKIISNLEIESTRVERILLDRMQSTYGIAKSVNLQILYNSHNKAHINEILQKFKSTPELSESFSWTIFSWSDSDYKLIVDAKYGIMGNHFDLSIRDYISLTKSNPGMLYLGNPVFGSTSKKWMIPGGVGLVDKDNKYLGATVIGFEIDALARVISKDMISKDINIEIINNNGVSILEVDSKYFGVPRKNKSSSNPEILRTLHESKNNKIDVVTNVSFAGNKQAFLIKNLKSPAYSLIFKYDARSINNFLWESLISRSLEIFTMTLTSIALLILVYKIEVLKQKLIVAKNIAENANEIKDKILFSISHDIKNYIFGIGGLGRMVIDSKNKSEILKNEDLQIVETICEQAEELRYFVEDLLDVNHIDAGGLSLGEIKEAKIQDIINSTLVLSKSLAIKNNVLIKTQIENDLPKFNCDPRRIKQVLMNLVGNALKYNKPNGEVIIVAKYLESSRQLCIEIIDSGFGMSEEEIKKYLAGNGSEIDKSDVMKIKNIDSHGIGVPIILRLVGLHNGKIEVESIKDSGTKVGLYFSLENSLKIKNKALSQKGEFLSDKSRKKKSLNKLILLVDDNPVNIKITCRILELEGYQVIYAENGNDAILMIEQHHPDLVLMDGEMPVMNGYDATIKIRKGDLFKSFKKFKTIPIIGLMSSSSEAVIQKSAESGMNDHLEKSTSKTKLLDIIARNLM